MSQNRINGASPCAGVAADATLIPLDDSTRPASVCVQIRDVSASGIGFLHWQKLSLDEQFALVLPQKDNSPAIVLCAVAFWQPLELDLYAIGARFLRILRDGAKSPLPISTEIIGVDFSDEIQKERRMAS